MSSVWSFIQNQVLGMRWLNDLVGAGLNQIGIDPAGYLGGSMQFFIYDVIKIFILLGTLIFAISYIQSYFPPERTRAILGRYRGLPANTIAALLGTVTPFCSCSSIPLFMGFTRAGLPVGVTFSFLISSPLVDLGSLILLTSIFNLEIALAYVAVGLVLAIFGGALIEKLGLGTEIEDFVVGDGPVQQLATPEMSRSERLDFAREETMGIARRVAPYIFIGVGIGAAIHNLVPQAIIEALLGNDNPFSVIIASLVGVPMYADIFGAIPVAEALHIRGVGIGTVLSFMMAVTALSLPSIIMLKKVVKPKLLGFFVAIVTGGIIAIGYLFNAIEHLFV